MSSLISKRYWESGAGWFQWALHLNTTVPGNNLWSFATCYRLGYLKYANLHGIPS